MSIRKVKASIIAKYANPYECWNDIWSPITFREVTYALKRDVVLQDEFYKLPLPVTSSEFKRRRREHADKIAFFIKNGFKKPISLDVGIPHMGYYVNYFVQDGNHRLASAIYKLKVLDQDSIVPLLVDGSIDYAEELKLW